MTDREAVAGAVPPANDADAATPNVLPYVVLGGEAGVRALVDRFYDLMDIDPEYAPLRAMHAEDLAPMRASLTDFLMAWMGGPRDWFDQRPGACIMSVHARLGITSESAEQWISAMTRAVHETVYDPPLAEAMLAAFGQMSRGMTRVP